MKCARYAVSFFRSRTGPTTYINEYEIHTKKRKPLFIFARGPVIERMKKHVRKEELYTAAGWINAKLLIECNEPFVVALGGRGIGKSYSILKELYDTDTPFIYMRRTQTQLDAITVPQLNPYNQIAADNNLSIITSKISKHTAGFYKGIENKDGEIVPENIPFALGVALSTFASIRSLSAERYDVLFFDEIIPERHEHPIKEEGLAFANVLESLNRNRELQNRKPLKVIMVSNSNTINSQILNAFGLLDIVDSMNRNNQYFKSVDSLVAVFRYIDSPISEQKKNSALYRVIRNRDFSDMAINNEFSQSDYENVQSKPLQEYTPLCSFGNVTVCRHKSKQEYYVIKGIKTPEHYDSLPLSKKAFNRKYYYVYGAMLDKLVYYQSAAVKIEIEGAFK